jgi:hypothetical protein
MLKLGFDVRRGPVELPAGHERYNLQSLAEVRILDQLAGIYLPEELVVRNLYPNTTASEDKDAKEKATATG